MNHEIMRPLAISLILIMLIGFIPLMTFPKA
jgi:hypothetical protein